MNLSTKLVKLVLPAIAYYILLVTLYYACMISATWLNSRHLIAHVWLPVHATWLRFAYFIGLYSDNPYFTRLFSDNPEPACLDPGVPEEVDLKDEDLEFLEKQVKQQ